jgi:hypothetical protein
VLQSSARQQALLLLLLVWQQDSDVTPTSQVHWKQQKKVTMRLGCLTMHLAAALLEGYWGCLLSLLLLLLRRV